MTNQIFSWQQAILQDDGLASTTKHLLLTLACYMNSMGESCYPSVRTLAKVTKLSARTIITHVEIAIEKGFIRKDVHGFKGQKWKRNEYVAVMPEQKTTQKSDNNNKGSEPSSPRLRIKGSEGGSPPSQKGGATDDKKVVKEVHTNRPLDLTSLSSSSELLDSQRDDLQKPPLPILKNDDDDFLECDANPIADLQIEEEEEEETTEVDSNHQAAYRLVDLHYELRREYLGNPIPTEPHLAREVEMAMNWVLAGVEFNFANNLMRERLVKLKLEHQKPFISFKYWDRFMVDNYRSAVEKNAYKPAKNESSNDLAGETVRELPNPEHVSIKCSEPNLRAHLDLRLGLPQNQWVTHCRAEMQRLCEADLWRQLHSGFAKKYGDGVLKNWIDLCLPVAVIEAKLQMIIWTPNRFKSEYIAQNYRNDFERWLKAITGKDFKVYFTN